MSQDVAHGSSWQGNNTWVWPETTKDQGSLRFAAATGNKELQYSHRHAACLERTSKLHNHDLNSKSLIAIMKGEGSQLLKNPSVGNGSWGKTAPTPRGTYRCHGSPGTWRRTSEG